MIGLNIALDAAVLPGRAATPVGAVTSARSTRGVAAGTLIATHKGVRPVEALVVGDRVHTFDHGLRPLVGINRTVLAAESADAPPSDWPVTIPAGTLGNARDMVVMPGQGLMVGSENAQDAMGDPFAVVPVQALEGLCGIHRSAPHQQTELFTLVFEDEEVVFSDGGQLLHFEGRETTDEATYRSAPVPCGYDVKSVSEARDMLTDLDVAELVLEDERHETLMHGRMARVA